ncbi:hypothetical protein [Chondrinema litorale]|nr:hypothetical protein [Chondrinema litorale]UZR99100.1 hypothetical protein OQ292_35105 [Chondrinema litorale]
MEGFKKEFEANNTRYDVYISSLSNQDWVYIDDVDPNSKRTHSKNY